VRALGPDIRVYRRTRREGSKNGLRKLLSNRKDDLGKHSNNQLMRRGAGCVAGTAVNNDSSMSDNSDNSFTDRYSTKRASQAWEEASSPIVRFRTDDGTCWGFIFHHLDYARFERDTLLLEWSIGTIRIRGPKAEIFFDKFANHQATSIGADGRDIESVTMRLKTDEAVEEAFAAIEKLTDADLNIEDEPDEQV
jgi:hypothetical protein